MGRRGWGGGRGVGQQGKFLWTENIKCIVPTSNDSEPAAWWNWCIPLRLSFDQCCNDADLRCKAIWDLLMKSCVQLLCIVKKSEKDRTIRLRLYKRFLTWKKGVSPHFSVCYMHENVVFHYESLSLCVSHLSLGKKMQHWWVIAQTISELLNESAEGGMVVYRILHLTIQEIRGLLGKNKAGSWKLLMYCLQNCLRWLQHSWGRQKTRKAL